MKKPPKHRQQPLIDLPPVKFDCFENALFSQGIRLIAGIDEVGRGPLAGPVVAAAVILPEGIELKGLKDSKQLDSKERERLFTEISAKAITYAFGVVESQEIDEINILQATFKAMRSAVEGLSTKPEYLLIDGQFGIGMNILQKPIIKGDALSISIAAASVLAKVERDRMMCELENKYPNFKFSVHKGYGTKLHYEELKKHGATPIHRLTFKGVPQ